MNSPAAASLFQSHTFAAAGKAGIWAEPASKDSGQFVTFVVGSMHDVDCDLGDDGFKLFVIDGDPRKPAF